MLLLKDKKMTNSKTYSIGKPESCESRGGSSCLLYTSLNDCFSINKGSYSFNVLKDNCKEKKQFPINKKVILIKSKLCNLEIFEDYESYGKIESLLKTLKETQNKKDELDRSILSKEKIAYYKNIYKSSQEHLKELIDKNNDEIHKLYLLQTELLKLEKEFQTMFINIYIEKRNLVDGSFSFIDLINECSKESFNDGFKKGHKEGQTEVKKNLRALLID